MSEVSVILPCLLLNVPISTSKVMKEEDPEFIHLRKGIKFSLVVLVLRLKKFSFKNTRIHKCQITAWGIATTACIFSSSMFVVPWGFFILNCKSFLSHLW